MKMYVVSVPLREKTSVLRCLTPHEKQDSSLGTSYSIFDEQLEYTKVGVSAACKGSSYTIIKH
jgi:hypothetical protein